MLDCHANAWFIRPGRCLGRKLKHLTPARLFLLEALQSPFIFGGIWDTDQLMAAILICSLPVRVTRYLMQHRAILFVLCFVWGLRIRLNNMRVQDEGANFSEYIQTYSARPNILTKEGDAHRESAFPNSLGMVWTLMERMPEKKAWNLPLPLALAYVGKNAECNGVEFETDFHRSLPLVNIEGA